MSVPESGGFSGVSGASLTFISCEDVRLRKNIVASRIEIVFFILLGSDYLDVASDLSFSFY